MKKLLLFTGYLLLHFAVMAQQAASSGYVTYRNIAYGDAEENVFDAYLPEGHNAKTRIIVYLHGGGWTGGDKNELPKQLIKELVGKLGYGVVSMNYRLIRDGKNVYPAQLDDIRTALSFISSKAERYQFDGAHFALMGGSAGAYLALQYAYAYDSLRQIKTVVDLWGPTDFTDKKVRQDNKEADEKVVRLLGGVADPGAQLAYDASPYFQLNANNGISTLIFHGEEDPLVDISQSVKLYDKLVSLHIPVQFEKYPGEKHGVGPAAAMDVFTKLISWFQKYYPAE